MIEALGKVGEVGEGTALVTLGDQCLHGGAAHVADSRERIADGLAAILGGFDGELDAGAVDVGMAELDPLPLELALERRDLIRVPEIERH